MGHGTYNCEVISANPNENFRALFNYSDDLAGKEIKNYLDSFVLSYKSEDYIPMTMLDSNFSCVEIESVMQYTTWQFHKYNYGLKTYKAKNHNTRELETNEIYINSKVADSIISSTSYSSYDELIGAEFKCVIDTSERKMVIVDIITNLDSINLGPYFSGCSIITRYVNTANWFKNLKYVYILRGGPLSKTYSLTAIEGSIKRLNSENKHYSSYYSKLVSNNLINNGINDLKINTFVFYSSGQNKRLILFLIATLILMLVMSVLIIYKVVGRELILSIFCSFLLYSFVMRFFDPTFIINGKIIILSSMMGSIVLLFVFVLSFCLYFLLELIGNDKKTSIIKDDERKE